MNHKNVGYAVKKIYGFACSKLLLTRARRLGLDIPSLLNAALAYATKAKKCPYCHQKLPLEQTTDDLLSAQDQKLFDTFRK